MAPARAGDDQQQKWAHVPTPDRYTAQLPDTDPAQTDEWLDSLDEVLEAQGSARARYLLSRLLERAASLGLRDSTATTTPYVNSIPVEREPAFPGDAEIEHRIRTYIRWNAVAMVVHANNHADGIGGHLSTFASSAALYDVGFNHFFRGKADGRPGDHVYFQGHAAPGIYARAFVEGRLSAADLARFRREVDLVEGSAADTPGMAGPATSPSTSPATETGLTTPARGLSSYPHPRLMGDFWEFPTVSMGLGPLMSIYHARFNRYLHNRQLADTSGSRVWCFVGDGECDEPETLGSISLASREGLDNLTWVVNCNLQRLDGPVRGNGKVIQELEAVFRGAGWNVVKVIWGARWDELLAVDDDGVLVDRMNTTVDGEFQRYAVESGAYIRERFFGPDERLQSMVSHLTDDELRTLPRGGHDTTKLYAAYHQAVTTTGAPTVILAKTVKGWALGDAVQGRNATHQIKKLSRDQLLALRSRLALTDIIPDDFDADSPPFVRPEPDSPEARYLRERRAQLGGSLPARRVEIRSPLPPLADEPTAELRAGSGTQAASTTTAFTRLLRNLCRDPALGRRIVPIIPDEARTFGMDALFREFEIYAPFGQRYEPVDHALLLSYAEDSDGQILEEGITEAGALSSWIAAGTAYATQGTPMIPFFTFYSMFGFQRVGDLIWAAADARARGFLMAATAGRTTLLGEGLQHQDGHSQLVASTVPPCRAYDPAFAYEVAAIVEEGIDSMYRRGEDVFYYVTLYNENYPMPPPPDAMSWAEVRSAVNAGLYRWQVVDPSGPADALTAAAIAEATILFSGPMWRVADDAAGLLATVGVRSELWSATSYERLRADALEVERARRVGRFDSDSANADPQPTPLVTRLLGTSSGPIVAVSDFMRAVPDQIARFVPAGRRWVSLGTDGFGRSDTREALRAHFEVGPIDVAEAVLGALVDDGVLDDETAGAAVREWRRGTPTVAARAVAPWRRDA